MFSSNSGRILQGFVLEVSKKHNHKWIKLLVYFFQEKEIGVKKMEK